MVRPHELECCHGIGHQMGLHGCDGCCDIIFGGLVEQTEERIIKSLDIERTGSHALDDLIDTLIFMNISRSDFKRGLIKLIKGGN